MKTFPKFLFSGGIAALVNWTSRFFFEYLVNFVVAVVFSYIVGMSVAFILNRVFVFNSNAAVVPEGMRFITVNLCSLTIVVSVSILMARFVFPAISFHWHAAAIAHAIGVISPVTLSYIAHQRYTFRYHSL